MSLPILSSPVLSLPIIDTLLRSTTDPTRRIQLLSARVHLLLDALPTRNLSPTTSMITSTSTSMTTSTSTFTSTSTLQPQPQPHSQPTTNPLPISTPLSQPLFTSDPQPSKTPTRPPPPDPTQLLLARTELARAYLAFNPPDLRGGESECLAIDGECKRLAKVGKRIGTGHTTAATADSPVNLPWDPREITRIRRGALEMLVDIEEGLGKPARAERWRGVVKQLEATI